MAAREDAVTEGSIEAGFKERGEFLLAARFDIRAATENCRDT
jgi:hypothetical protein